MNLLKKKKDAIGNCLDVCTHSPVLSGRNQESFLTPALPVPTFHSTGPQLWILSPEYLLTPHPHSHPIFPSDGALFDFSFSSWAASHLSPEQTSRRADLTFRPPSTVAQGHQDRVQIPDRGLGSKVRKTWAQILALSLRLM